MIHTLENKDYFETPTLEFKELEKGLTPNYPKEGNNKDENRDNTERTLFKKTNKVQGC